MMRLLHDMAEYTEGACVLALGTFDGVHRGHAALIRRTVELARQQQIAAAALTFDRHPMALLHPQRAPRCLTAPQEKQERMEALGLDLLVEQPFTRQYAAQSPRAFVEGLMRCMRPRILVVGWNYSFGKAAAGNAQLLRDLGGEMGFDVEVIAPVVWEGEAVSSTRIRALLAEGQREKAEQLAGHALEAPLQNALPET